MSDDYGLAMSGVDPESFAELRRLRREEAIADAMYKQGMTPLQGGMVGNVYVRPSITQGLAQLANSYFAGERKRAIDKGYADLGEKRSAKERTAWENVAKALSGTPEKKEMMYFDDSGVGSDLNVTTPAVPGSPERAEQVALESPFTRQVGQALLLQRMKPYTLGPGQAMFGPDNKQIASVPAKPEDQEDKIKQYNFAKTPAGGNYKGTFAQFISLAPSITAAAMAPLRAAQVENISSENEYNLPPKRTVPPPPKIGQVVDGYKFKGGDPANQINWEKQ